MNRLLIAGLILGFCLVGCVDDGDDGLYQQPQQPQQTQTQPPVLDSAWFQQTSNAEVTFDAEGIPEHVLERHQSGAISQLNSLQDLFVFEAGEMAAGEYETGEQVPLKLAFDVKKASHIGEYNLIISNTTGKPVIATVEPISGGKPYAFVDLSAQGFGATSETAPSIFDLDLGVPASGDDPIPVILFVCLDSNDNGRCNDERIKNLNFYINQVPNDIVAEQEISRELERILSADLATDTETEKLLKGIPSNRGLVYYAQNAILDPIKGKLMDYNTFTKQVGAEFSQFGGFAPKYFREGEVSGDAPLASGAFASTEAVETVFTMVDEMLRSENAAIGSEMVSVETGAPLEITIPLVQYEATLFSAAPTAGDEFAPADPTGGETGGETGELETGGDEFDDAVEVVGPGTGSTCSAVCTCLPDGSMKCVVSGPVNASQIGRCQEACACKAAGQSGLVCEREPRITGCFVEGTLLRTGEQAMTPVEKLMPKDTVLDAKNRPRQVLRAVAGPEKEKVLYLTTVSGQRLGVSEGHPMMTARGLILARELTPADKLLRANGTYSELAGIERVLYTKLVYNIALDGTESEVETHLLQSNGLITGDLVLQNSLAKPAATASVR